MNKRISKDLARECTDRLSHRGPDGGNVWQSPISDVTLGHRRLSILDLSEAGAQPMRYGDGRYMLSFNGEIYNFLELRQELKALGHEFHSESDSEVLLVAYIEWGEKCLLRFNGMWAFSIWDEQEKKMFLSRDRFGVKPLYYTIFEGNGVSEGAAKVGEARDISGGIAYASEMKALIPMMDAPQPNEALFRFYEAHLHYENQPECLVKGIYRFPAGHYAVLQNGKMTLTKWWETLDHLMEVPETYEEQVELFQSLFLDSCKLRMRSDVTLGTALSGGLDSSATICAMGHLAKMGGMDSRMSGDWQHAFVACFPGSNWDETRYARKVTDYLGITSTYLDIDMNVSESELMKDIYLFEELWNMPQIPMMQIYGKERADGVRVSVDGHAADELFAGYNFDQIKALWDARGCSSLSRKQMDDIVSGYLADDEYRSELTAGEFRKFRNQQVREALLKGYGKKLLRRPMVRSLANGHPAFEQMDYLTQTLYVSTHETILPTMLRNYDRNSMANGVEIRMPFLDHRLVEFAFSIPWSSKVGEGFGKRIIRDGISDFVPKDIAYRKSKIGFNSPLQEFMLGSGREMILDIVHGTEFGNCELVRDAQFARDLADSKLGSGATKVSDKNLKIKDLGMTGDGGDFTTNEAAALWGSLQPYLWKKAMLGSKGL